MTMEQGKPLIEAKMETMGAADSIDWYAEKAEEHMEGLFHLEHKVSINLSLKNQLVLLLPLLLGTSLLTKLLKKSQLLLQLVVQLLLKALKKLLLVWLNL